MRPVTKAELAILTSTDVRTVERNLADAGITEIGRKGRAVLYDSTAALRAMYRAGGSAKDRVDEGRAQLIELELAERRGQLMQRSVVAAEQVKREATIRARGLAMPSKLAPQVAPPGKLQQVEDAITAAVYEMLSDLAGDGATGKR